MQAAKLRKPLTRFGHSKLVDEHRRLLLVERPKVVDGIARAAAEGDRSENAEYIYGKKRLRAERVRLHGLAVINHQCDEGHVAKRAASVIPALVRQRPAQPGGELMLIWLDTISAGQTTFRGAARANT